MILSDNAKKLLAKACEAPAKQIINNNRNLDGNKYIAINGETINEESFESYSFWLSVLEELVANDLVKQANDIIFNVTPKGVSQNNS